jgi:hypothetical protein
MNENERLSDRERERERERDSFSISHLISSSLTLFRLRLKQVLNIRNILLLRAAIIFIKIVWLRSFQSPQSRLHFRLARFITQNMDRAVSWLLSRGGGCTYETSITPALNNIKTSTPAQMYPSLTTIRKHRYAICINVLKAPLILNTSSAH